MIEDCCGWWGGNEVLFFYLWAWDTIWIRYGNRRVGRVTDWLGLDRGLGFLPFQLDRSTFGVLRLFSSLSFLALFFFFLSYRGLATRVVKKLVSWVSVMMMVGVILVLFFFLFIP